MEAPDGIPGSVLTGPYPVGDLRGGAARPAARVHARAGLRRGVRVQGRAGEGVVRAARRRGRAAVLDVARGLRQARARRRWPTARRWSSRAAATTTPARAPRRPGSRFAVTRLRVAGEGDLLAQLEQLRRRLHAEGLFAPQKALARPVLPRCIGVVTGESGKARDDVLAGLRRRGWAGRLVWGFAPVQDRHAAPAITRALQDLAACEEVEVIVVARGGGSLADLFAFCDETLCRTVALLRVPVISSRRPPHGPHAARRRRRRRLLDAHPRRRDRRAGRLHAPPAPRSAAQRRRLERQGRRAVLERARTLARLSRAPAHHVARHRTRLHQHLRELRAATRRAVAAGERTTLSRATRRWRARRPRPPPRATAPRRRARAGRRRAGPHRRRRARAPPPRPGPHPRHARRPRPAAHAGARLRAARGPGGRAGHERRGRPRAAVADGPPARRPRHASAREDEPRLLCVQTPRARDALRTRAGGHVDRELLDARVAA